MPPHNGGVALAVPLTGPHMTLSILTLTISHTCIGRSTRRTGNVVHMRIIACQRPGFDGSVPCTVGLAHIVPAEDFKTDPGLARLPLPILWRDPSTIIRTSEGDAIQH